GEVMPISCDQVSSPTWVRDLAPALVRLSAHRPSGIFHLTGEGHVSRDDFARAALEASGLDPGLVRGVENYPSPARRPHYSALTNTRARALSIRLPSWEDSVRDYVTSIGAASLDETVA
ncbi:MAG TPA: sugar nucleotide-binding protein, partial [Chloroflexota bacterium]|nr:sugar nucleotide-binding protein [Chloroflexota bacterium]